MEARERILLLRGQFANPWDLRPWADLPDRFDVACLVGRRNVYPTAGIPVEQVRVRTLRDLLPPGMPADVAAGALGNRYLGADEEFRRASVVHASELAFWFAGEAARLKSRHAYKLVVTVWETIPMLNAYRSRRARRYRSQVFAAADLFLAATERARDALMLEGVDSDRIIVCHPGIDVERFRRGAAVNLRASEHVVVSPGRLVWEKGHQDVIRAVAALRRNLVPRPSGAAPRVLIVGSGPEEERLRAYAGELGVADAVEFRSVPYEQMPEVFAEASCMVLASLPSAGCSLYLGDVPRCFWEEQFGLVLIEAMAAGLPILTTTSGAIPEVVGDDGLYFAPGDWMDLAGKLARGPLTRPPATRVEYPADRVGRYSTHAMAERLAAAYDRVLAAA